MTLQLARALGQSETILRDIEEGKVHPIMAAFGLWSDSEDIEVVESEISRNRKRKTTRPEVEL